MPQCWPWRRPCFLPSVNCGARHEAHSSLAAIFQARRGRVAIGEGIAPARGSSRCLATLADRQFSLFSATFRLVERPDAAFEKRAAVSGLVGHDNNPVAWTGSRGRGGNRSWSVHWCISTAEPRHRTAARILEGYSATGDRPRGDPFHGL